MLRAVKEEAEKPEKEAKDQHRKLWEEQQAASKAQREQELAANAFQELDDDMDGVVSVAELQTHPELDTDGDGALSEGEAQTLLGETPRRMLLPSMTASGLPSGTSTGLRFHPPTCHRHLHLT